MPDDDATQGDIPAEPAGQTAENRIAALERELAFSRVLPADVLETPQGRFFAESYSGDLGLATVRGKAIELGLIADPNAQAPDDPAAQAGTATTGEQEAFDAARDLATGGVPAGSDPGPHPRELAREAGDAARKRGGTDQGLAAYFASAISSAASGDGRGTVDLARQYFGSGQPARA